jgi:hypothetical protein
MDSVGLKCVGGFQDAVFRVVMKKDWFYMAVGVEFSCLYIHHIAYA